MPSLFRALAFLLSGSVTAASVITPSLQRREAFINRTTCNGKTYTYQELAGYGFVASNAVDKFGDNLGGLGSAIALDRSTWKKIRKGSYEGILWTLPDRGWNTEGTINYQPRVHKFRIMFKEKPDATIANPSEPNLQLTYLDPVRFTGPDGTPVTGLDPDVSGFLSYPGFPTLPAATYIGDGVGGPGSGGKRISVDSEGFWVSDEYGPYIYKFDQTGNMVTAIRPPEAYIPRRNGSVSFSANTAPCYDPNKTVTPENAESGRNNNQGLEGLAVTGDGNNLYVLTQSALNQEGGPARQTNRYARLLKYDIRTNRPRFAREFVVPLPQFNNPSSSGKSRTAAQSEIFYIQDGHFFVLSRDSGAGYGQVDSLSLYRQIDVFDIKSATDIKSPANDAATGAIASKDGVLRADIIPATYCSFLDFNVNSQLGRFGLRNGGAQEPGLLNEKWESIAIAPVDGKDGDDDEWFLISLSDNDFITQDGFLNGGQFKYADGSGFSLENQALVFKIKLPERSRPFTQKNGD
ncbi:hypothetical protein MMC16_002208 [Acarospora aff. strigata]|nr:hypothetical protein [Acarospora aff. strigata]